MLEYGKINSEIVLHYLTIFKSDTIVNDLHEVPNDFIALIICMSFICYFYNTTAYTTVWVTFVTYIS